MYTEYEAWDVVKFGLILLSMMFGIGILPVTMLFGLSGVVFDMIGFVIILVLWNSVNHKQKTSNRTL